ncbi:hypothetical protein [Paenarthrobacter ilicis]|uniref:hypothetical protein n=1 Tax=Paenarthrobacter ilicis TaxID=43665 RepID=UPI0028D902E9|nr:hypothetical protein [Paenarthrobacter ilicis]
MANTVDVLGPILEVMTWVGFVPGVPLLVSAWVISRRRCVWATADGIRFAAGGFLGVQWQDQAHQEHKVLLDIPAHQDTVVSGAVLVHYDLCHPSRCSLEPPRHDNTVLILGWILTGLGILSTLGGFVLLLFQ